MDDAERPADELQNATRRPGGEAVGGVTPRPGDPTSPKEANARAAEREQEAQERGLGDDGARSVY